MFAVRLALVGGWRGPSVKGSSRGPGSFASTRRLLLQFQGSNVVFWSYIFHPEYPLTFHPLSPTHWSLCFSLVEPPCLCLTLPTTQASDVVEKLVEV